MNVDITIVGAGIIGLSTAYQLKKQMPTLKIAILEKESAIALHQTGNNSGVIHSGIYYKPESEKAKNCIAGYSKMLDFCKEQQIPYNLCGKIIVAKNAGEIKDMELVYQRGIDKGMKDLSILDQQGIKEIEPNIEGYKGIHVPQAGIVDYKLVAKKIAELLKNQGCQFFFGETLQNVNKATNSLIITSTNKKFETKSLINCAGLYSDKIAKLTDFEINYKIIPFRGEYYKLAVKHNELIKGLVYPVPNPNLPFLGVHLTKKMDGSIEAGPNAVLAFKREGYRLTDFNLTEFSETLMYRGFHKLATKYTSVGLKEMWRSMSKRKFLNELRDFVPSLKMQDITYKGAGVRAQACDKEGNLLDDFLILKNENIINVCNAPSPAATSCFAIGDTIANLCLNQKKEINNVN